MRRRMMMRMILRRRGSGGMLGEPKLAIVAVYEGDELEYYVTI